MWLIFLNMWPSASEKVKTLLLQLLSFGIKLLLQMVVSIKCCFGILSLIKVTTNFKFYAGENKNLNLFENSSS